MGKLKKLGLVARTVRYMTPRQCVYRIWYTLRPGGKQPKAPALQPKPIPLGFGPGEADLKTADGLLKLEFPLVSGFVARFTEKVDWDLADNDYRLQCFRLNSFDFLHTLSDAYRATGDPRYVDFGLWLMENWQSHCAKVGGDKWNAYPTAQRIANWVGFVSQNAPAQAGKIAPWVYAQAKVLSRNVEYHLGANHLLTEGKALMYAGAFLQEDKLFRQGKRLLEKEYPWQFLADGGHYEGSLSYHIESLQQYFEAVMLMQHCQDADWRLWAKKLQNNYQYLCGLLGANGTIPLYNDSAFDYCAEAKDFLATSGLIFETPAPGSRPGPYCRRWKGVSQPLQALWKAPETRLYEETGLFVDHFGPHSFYLRCGDLGPDSNLGHAHADQLSLLWQTAEGEIFADSGVFTYQAGERRNACRATSAHNTVEIDGCNSAEIWAAFRTARRGHGKVIACKGSAMTARHNGYAKILGDGLTHQRTYIRKDSTVTVVDELSAKKKHHTAVLRYHLAPDCRVERLDDHRVLLAGKYILECSEPMVLEPCQIAGSFGRMQDSLCLTANWTFRGASKVETIIIL